MYAYVIKNDQPGVLISDGVVFQEGYTGGYSIVLATEPTDQVTVSLTSTSALITFTPSSIIFTRDDWDIPQEISLETTEDETPRGLQYSASITHSVYSADPNYNAIVPIPNDIISVSVINPCRGGMWAWPPGSGECNLCPQGYKCPTLYGDKVACTSKEYSPLGA